VTADQSWYDNLASVGHGCRSGSYGRLWAGYADKPARGSTYLRSRRHRHRDKCFGFDLGKRRAYNGLLLSVGSSAQLAEATSLLTRRRARLEL
jgi:hypothetical protein